MASGQLQPPGAKFGPCPNPCSHKDCAKTREMAGTKCRICGDAIGYETSFYQEGDWTKLVHAVCVEDEEEQIAKPAVYEFPAAPEILKRFMANMPLAADNYHWLICYLYVPLALAFGDVVVNEDTVRTISQEIMRKHSGFVFPKEQRALVQTLLASAREVKVK